MDDFKNNFFINKINSEAKKVYDEIKEQGKKIDYTKLVCLGLSTKHQYNFTIVLDLKTFAESLYNSSLSLKIAKLKQRDMENENTGLEYYNPKKQEIKTHKKVFFLMQKNFAKKEKLFLLHLKIMYFHCLNNIYQKI